ncbi:MAG: insulinase family protein, partial [Gemmobacter sp.]|uniref:M16 family metallopeptidase n=1 Tax=Gemmobacter sp. TaxID=1898957 RepID=UPI001A44C5C8
QSGNQKEAAALLYLAELLGGSGTTSLFAKQLQFTDPTAVYSYAAYDGTALDSGSFILGLMPLPGIPPEQAEAAMDKVIADFLKSGPDPAAFDRIRTQLRAAEIYGRDDVQDQAQRYGEALTTGLTVADVQAWPQVLQEVTPDDVMQAARKVLNRNNAVTGWLLTEEAAQ